jgi:hypothetical protein
MLHPAQARNAGSPSGSPAHAPSPSDRKRFTRLLKATAASICGM